MKGNWSYAIQGVGVVLAAIGLVLILDRRLAIGLIVFGCLTFEAGRVVRHKGIL